MSNFLSCACCGGFVPSNLSACPNCGSIQSNQASKSRVQQARSTSRKVLGGLAALGGGALAMTLSACYGGGVEESYCSDYTADTDGDGYCLAYDCDETDTTIHRYSFDTPDDGIDQNCDGVDEMSGMSDGGDASDGGASSDGGATDDGGATEDGGMSPTEDGGMSAEDGGAAPDAGM